MRECPLALLARTPSPLLNNKRGAHRPFLAANRITHLSLAANKLGKDGAAQLVRNLVGNTSIVSLDLSRNMIGEVDWTPLKHVPNLTWLFLSGNHLEMGSGYLAALLASPTCSIAFLHIDGCSLTDRNFGVIANGLKKNNSLVTVSAGSRCSSLESHSLAHDAA